MPVREAGVKGERGTAWVKGRGGEGQRGRSKCSRLFTGKTGHVWWGELWSSAMTIETVGSYRSRWGEGPIWWEGRLFYVDIEGHRVIALDPVSGAEETWEVGQRVGFVVPRAGGGLVFGGDQGLFLLNLEDGKTTPISNPEEGQENNRFNDGKCAPDGFLFAGTISLVKETGEASLYRLAADHSVTEVLDSVTNSNGIAWSRDGAECYYIDTPLKNVQAFQYHGGELSESREVISTADLEASPDGMTIDAEGNLWIAFCHGACVRCYDPKSGKLLQEIELPCLETTACAFGGENLDELYVTTGVHKTEIEEEAGLVFRITGIGVKGLPALTFAG